MFPTIKFYMVEAMTGCTCCNDQNFTAAPFLSKEDAEARMKSYRSTSRLASQYAPNGNYYLREREGEQLPDGRIIYNSNIIGPDPEEYDQYSFGLH